MRICSLLSRLKRRVQIELYLTVLGLLLNTLQDKNKADDKWYNRQSIQASSVHNLYQIKNKNHFHIIERLSTFKQDETKFPNVKVPKSQVLSEYPIYNINPSDLNYHCKYSFINFKLYL